MEVEDALGGGGVPVEHGAGHRGEGVAGDDGGLDGELVDVRSGLLRTEGPSKLMQINKNWREMKIRIFFFGAH